MGASGLGFRQWVVALLGGRRPQAFGVCCVINCASDQHLCHEGLNEYRTALMREGGSRY